MILWARSVFLFKGKNTQTNVPLKDHYQAEGIWPCPALLGFSVTARALMNPGYH